jgi:hypothetical protein
MLTSPLQPSRAAADVGAMAATPIYTQARESAGKTPPAELAQLGAKLPTAPASTAERVRASLILCPAR